jgi:hypothetical protein
MSTYTFVCQAENQVVIAVDIPAWPWAAIAAVEIWRDDAVVAVIDRTGVRALGAQMATLDHAAVEAATHGETDVANRRSLKGAPAPAPENGAKHQVFAKQP